MVRILAFALIPDSSRSRMMNAAASLSASRASPGDVLLFPTLHREIVRFFDQIISLCNGWESGLVRESQAQRLARCLHWKSRQTQHLSASTSGHVH